MKLKFALLFICLCTYQFSIAQSTTTNTAPQEEPVQERITTYTDKEWKKIKKQLKRNQKRIARKKYQAYTKKAVDTIYLNIPSKTNTRLTDL